ncbi:MAG: tRNA modification radical SAM protein MnmL/YtqA [Planctomycetota bacterium]|jgi:radical SAM protein (TIGR01212 family)
MTRVYAAERPWRRELRYYSFGHYLRERFPFKVHKIALHAGFTCPNRDGHKGSGGCTFCANETFSPYAKGAATLSIKEQVRSSKEFLRSRYGAEKFIVYFQAFSNTYADIETLRSRYGEAMDDEDVVGLSIGTRPDCVSDEALELIGSYADTHHVWIEYGLQSIHDETLRRINRCHTYQEFEDAVYRTRAVGGINVCAHVILGLPAEERSDMMATASKLSGLGINGIKLHHLYVARNTALEKEYLLGKVKTTGMEEYVSLAADFLERLSPDMTVQRLVGDTRGDDLVSPVWPASKAEVVQAITGELRRRGSCQGAQIVP